MKQIPGWASCGLGLLGVLVAGCSSADELKKLCIPTVDCGAINTIETPGNCSVCLTCQDNWGSCSPGGSACKRGSLDLDPSTPGCESVVSDARGQRVLHSTPDSFSSLSFNGGQFLIPMTVSVLAYSEDDPSCVPTFEQGCAYTVHALQLEIPDFTIPESSWSNGVATLTGPVAGVDTASGAEVIAPMLFAFDVQEGSTRRIALNVAVAKFRASVSAATVAAPEQASLLIEVDSIDFGGYQIKNLLFNGELIPD